MLVRRSVKESSIDVLEGTGPDQYSKIKNIQTSQRGHRVRVGMNCRDYYGPWRCTLERAQEDLVIMHTCRRWVTKKAKLLELLKAAGNGVVRRGGRKPVPCAGVPKVAAVVVASCGAGSVGGMVSKPLPYGWYSKQVNYSKSKHIQTTKQGHRVRVGLNCTDRYGPWRAH